MPSTLRTPRRVASRATSSTGFILASMPRRVLGAWIDLVLVLVVSGMFVAWLDSRTSGVTRIRIDATTGERLVDHAWTAPTWFPLAAFVVIMALYVVPSMALWGRTLGGWAVGIRCVRVDTGGAPGWTVSVRRWLVLYGAAAVVGFAPVVGPWAWLITLVVGLSPLWDATHRLRGYADHVAGDLVVRAAGGGSSAAGGGPSRR